ncbi:MAG: NADPH-dependent FMN reductase [Acidimicrobiales bacterium]
MKVMVVSAISRESSTCFQLARFVADAAVSHGVEVDFTHPANAGLPVNDGTVAWDDPRAKAWQDRIDAIHAHLWISPEYHSGMTGGMKNLFDHLAKEPLRGDVVGLFALAGGAMAALNTLNNMTVVARSLGAWVAPEFAAVNSNEVKDGLQDSTKERVDRIVATVIDTSRRLQPEAEADDTGIPF